MFSASWAFATSPARGASSRTTWAWGRPSGITLLWTLLRQGITRDGAPTASRALIVCPTSLVSNWDDECNKWLKGRVRTMPVCESSRADVVSAVSRFLGPRNTAQVMIVSYETFRIHAGRSSRREATASSWSSATRRIG